jgi:hypothetical protein
MALDEKPDEIRGVFSQSTASSAETTRCNSQTEKLDVEKALATLEDKAEPTTIVQHVDPDIVDWDGPDDPENPLNWPARRKWMNIGLLSAITLLTLALPNSRQPYVRIADELSRPFGSSMFAPSVPQVMKDFNSDNTDLASFVVSVYVLGYAFGPLVM